MPSRLRVDTGKSQLLQPDVVLANDRPAQLQEPSLMRVRSFHVAFIVGWR
jgi:hypothetical protein